MHEPILGMISEFDFKNISHRGTSDLLCDPLCGYKCIFFAVPLLLSPVVSVDRLKDVTTSILEHKKVSS